MSRYIDADKIISHLNDEIEGCEDCDVCFRPVTYGTRLGLEYSKSLVETAETADVQEVKHAKWLLYRFGLEVVACSICGAVYEGGDSFRFCPKCGAKMDLEENNEGN